MRGPSIPTVVISVLCCAGMIVPQSAVLAAQQVSPRPSAGEQAPSVIDVALASQGTLRGQVVDPQGIAVADAPVLLLAGGRKVATTTTDARGHFTLKGISGGVYGLAAAGGAKVCRLWAPHTAPPAANHGVLIVSDVTAVRGRIPLRNCQQAIYTWVSEHYLLTCTAIAAAITVPIVLANEDDDGPKSP